MPKTKVKKTKAKADPVASYAAEQRKREEVALRRQEATAKRLATLERKAAEEAAAVAQKAEDDRTSAIAMEADVYKKYEKALQTALKAKGDDLRPAWRKVEQLQNTCISVSSRARLPVV